MCLTMDNIKLKICGLKNESNILEVIKHSPDYIGFVFCKNSLRDASGMLSHEFTSALPSDIKKVGVFVDDSEGRIINYIALYNLDFVQLHGNESPEYCERIKKYCRIIKAFGVDEHFDFSSTKQYENVCDYFLFDTKTKLHGGSGTIFDHSLLKNYAGKKEFFLSGGISELNISEVLGLRSVFSGLIAVDVNSKIETAPGIKDTTKIVSIKNQLKNHKTHS